MAVAAACFRAASPASDPGNGRPGDVAALAAGTHARASATREVDGDAGRGTEGDEVGQVGEVVVFGVRVAKMRSTCGSK